MFKEIKDQKQWDQIVNHSEYNHPLQLWGWGDVKKINNWVPIRVQSEDSKFAAQILLKKIPGLNRWLAYCPRGPVAPPEELQSKVGELKEFLRKKKVISLRIEPSYSDNTKLKHGFHLSRNKILMNKTLRIDLNKTYEQIKSDISSSAKNSINKSLKNIEVKGWREIDGFIDKFYDIYLDTASRGRFKLQPKKYYQSILENFEDNLDIKMAIDKESGKCLCFLWNAFSKSVTFELYAGMYRSASKTRANYGVKFNAINDAKNRGSNTYDFNGRLDGGVAEFKKQFGPDEVDLIPTQELRLGGLSPIVDLSEKIIRAIR